MKFPEGINKKQKKYLKEVYFKSLKKSKRYAKARFYEEVFKIFKEQNDINILNIWEDKKYLKEELDYKKYKIKDKTLLVSIDEKLLKKKGKYKGIIKNMDKLIEKEILFKIKEKYEIDLSPEMYYVIK